MRHQDLQHFPCIQMKLKLQKKDNDGGKPRTLNIRLEKINSKRNTSRAFAPRFPKVKMHVILSTLYQKTWPFPALLADKKRSMVVDSWQYLHLWTICFKKSFFHRPLSYPHGAPIWDNYFPGEETLDISLLVPWCSSHIVWLVLGLDDES